jgi:hypothetical protein
MVGAIIQVAAYLLVAAGGEAVQRDWIKQNAPGAPYYVECKRGRFTLVGFETLNDARDYAISSTITDSYRWNEKPEDRTAKIFENGGRHLETYIAGVPQSNYDGVDAVLTKREKDTQRALILQNGAVARGFPYYIYVESYIYNAFVTLPLYLAANTFDQAKEYAVRTTIGLYKMNGQLGDNKIKIFERGGKHIETIIGGFPEEEYNRMVTERKKKEGNKEVKVVTSGGWDSSKMR